MVGPTTINVKTAVAVTAACVATLAALRLNEPLPLIGTFAIADPVAESDNTLLAVIEECDLAVAEPPRANAPVAVAGDLVLAEPPRVNAPVAVASAFAVTDDAPRVRAPVAVIALPLLAALNTATTLFWSSAFDNVAFPLCVPE
jgi:hypothetical protein